MGTDAHADAPEASRTKEASASRLSRKTADVSILAQSTSAFQTRGSSTLMHCATERTPRALGTFTGCLRFVGGIV